MDKPLLCLSVTHSERERERERERDTYNDVSGLDVTVNNVERVQVLQSGEHLSDQFADVFLGVRRQIVHVLEQINTLQVHHPVLFTFS